MTNGIDYNEENSLVVLGDDQEHGLLARNSKMITNIAYN